MNELSIVVAMLVGNFLSCLMFYSIGFREGKSEGYMKGRSAARHASSRAANQ
jgi:hypothetical protein